MMELGGMRMSRREQFTYGVLVDFEARRITREEAAVLLEVEPRSVSRKAARFRAKGLAGLQHGNSGKVPTNRTPVELKVQVLELVKSKYFAKIFIDLANPYTSG